MKKEVYSKLMCISIADLKRMGYLEGQNKCGVITSYWGNTNRNTYAISVNFKKDHNEFIQFEYISEGKEISYSVPLVKVKSNLPTGGSFYRFKCSISNKHASKLYFCNSRLMFVAGTEINGKYYSQSHNWKGKSSEPFRYGLTYRKWCKSLEEIKKKNCKRVYAGKMTKKWDRFIKLNWKIKFHSENLMT
jgi:hypothetical protein